jgi:hypothetical protein
MCIILQRLVAVVDSLYQYYAGHFLLYDICYTRRFGSWPYSPVQVIGCHYNCQIHLLLMILGVL